MLIRRSDTQIFFLILFFRYLHLTLHGVCAHVYMCFEYAYVCALLRVCVRGCWISRVCGGTVYQMLSLAMTFPLTARPYQPRKPLDSCYVLLLASAVLAPTLATLRLQNITLYYAAHCDKQSNNHSVPTHSCDEINVTTSQAE